MIVRKPCRAVALFKTEGESQLRARQNVRSSVRRAMLKIPIFGICLKVYAIKLLWKWTFIRPGYFRWNYYDTADSSMVKGQTINPDALIKFF